MSPLSKKERKGKQEVSPHGMRSTDNEPKKSTTKNDSASGVKRDKISSTAVEEKLRGVMLPLHLR